MLVSEATEKTGILFAPYAERSPEATSGLFARGLFWWLNPLFRLGFRGVVNDGDLFTADRELLSNACEVRFKRYWVNRVSSILWAFPFPGIDEFYRQEIPGKAYSSMGHAAGHVRSSSSLSPASSGVDFLWIHATPAYQPDHRPRERPGLPLSFESWMGPNGCRWT